MNVLAEKIAEFLEIGVEKAVEVYPILRGQFIAYEITEFIGGLMFWLIIITLVGFVTWLFLFMEWEHDDDYKALKTFKKVALRVPLLIVFFIVISIIANLLQIVLASDLLMFKQLL